MQYRNKKTGAVIHTTLKVNGENWEQISAPNLTATEEKSAQEKQPSKRKRKKEE